MTTMTGAPNPVLTYQGSHLVQQSSIEVGPFLFKGTTSAMGLNFYSKASEVRSYFLRPERLVVMEDPHAADFLMHYDQNGTGWEMIFRITTDPLGGVVGTSFAMDVESNYPEIDMSIGKIKVEQPAFGALVHNQLPDDYVAEIKVRFWQNGERELPLDAWLMLEVAYVKIDVITDEMDFDNIPKVPIGTATFYPAPADSKGGVLGGNYPYQLSS